MENDMAKKTLLLNICYSTKFYCGNKYDYAIEFIIKKRK